MKRRGKDLMWEMGLVEDSEPIELPSNVDTLKLVVWGKKGDPRYCMVNY